MKTSIKDIAIGAFAIIGFYVVVTGFNSPVEQQAVMTATPESHVWEIVPTLEGTGVERVYTLNKVTGEVRKYSKSGMKKGDLKDQYYQVLHENREGEK